LKFQEFQVTCIAVVKLFYRFLHLSDFKALLGQIVTVVTQIVTQSVKRPDKCDVVYQRVTICFYRTVFFSAVVLVVFICIIVQNVVRQNVIKTSVAC
jgi:hypothetical protein